LYTKLSPTHPTKSIPPIKNALQRLYEPCRKDYTMNMELYEIWSAIAKISDGITNQKIEFTYDRLMGAMGNCHPIEALDIILNKIDWECTSPDIDMLKEALEDLTEFNECFKIKELMLPIDNLKEFISTKGA
jgi:hypothetical protein